MRQPVGTTNETQSKRLLPSPPHPTLEERHSEETGVSPINSDMHFQRERATRRHSRTASDREQSTRSGRLPLAYCSSGAARPPTGQQRGVLTGPLAFQGGTRDEHDGRTALRMNCVSRISRARHRRRGADGGGREEDRATDRVCAPADFLPFGALAFVRGRAYRHTRTASSK